MEVFKPFPFSILINDKHHVTYDDLRSTFLTMDGGESKLVESFLETYRPIACLNY